MRDKISNIIKGRTCCVLTHGASLKNLEYHIKKIDAKKLCWVGMNQFPPSEEILESVGLQFDIISDCSNVPNKEYENKIRLPRFWKYLKRDNNLLLTSRTVIKDCFREDILNEYKEKIVAIENLFDEYKDYPSLFEPPPNSITLLFAFLIAGGAKKIIVFGLDGTNKPNRHCLDTYYKPNEIKKERLIAFGKEEIGSLNTDSKDFESRFLDILNLYKEAFDNPDVEIVNCSPKSYFSIFRKISYEELKREL